MQENLSFKQAIQFQKNDKVLSMLHRKNPNKKLTASKDTSAKPDGVQQSNSQNAETTDANHPQINKTNQEKADAKQSSQQVAMPKLDLAKNQSVLQDNPREAKKKESRHRSKSKHKSGKLSSRRNSADWMHFVTPEHHRKAIICFKPTN